MNFSTITGVGKDLYEKGNNMSNITFDEKIFEMLEDFPYWPSIEEFWKSLLNSAPADGCTFGDVFTQDMYVTTG